MNTTYTVITLDNDAEMYLSHQYAYNAQDALLAHAISMGHIAGTPGITAYNIGDTLADDDINYIVVEGHTSIASFEYKQS